MADTAVARALRCRDIQVEIFEQMSVNLCLDGVDLDRSICKSWRRALAVSARVCRAFSEPALGALWRELDDIAVLFRVLPSLETRREDINRRLTQSFSDEITPDEWSRLQCYARRIRLLRGCDGLHTLHGTVWAFVDGVRQDQPLLPNLVRLELLVPTENAASTYFRLLSPSLRHLKISFFEKQLPSITGALIQLIASKLPQLKTFSVGGGLHNLPARYLRALSRFHQLQTLDVLYSGVSLPLHVLKLISQNTTLHTLEAEVTSDGVGGEEDLDFGNGFLELLEINLGGRPQDLIQFFAHARLRDLVGLRISMSSTPTEQTISTTLSSICGSVPPTIVHLGLHFPDKNIEPSIPSSSADLFRPLSTLRNLSDIDIEFDYYLPSFSEGDAEEFATTWFKLDCFRLDTMDRAHSIDYYTVPQPTVAALAKFAQHCPKLHMLNLTSLDVRTIPSEASFSAIGHGSLGHLSIKRLVGGATADLLDVATILDKLFPHICTSPSATVQSVLGRAGFESRVPTETPGPYASSAWTGGRTGRCADHVYHLEGGPAWAKVVEDRILQQES